MKTPKLHYQCPLGRAAPQPIDTEQVKQQGWRRQQILVVTPDDPRLDWVEREWVRQLGERLYGQAGKGGHHE